MGLNEILYLKCCLVYMCAETLHFIVRILQLHLFRTHILAE